MYGIKNTRSKIYNSEYDGYHLSNLATIIPNNHCYKSNAEAKHKKSYPAKKYNM